VLRTDLRPSTLVMLGLLLALAVTQPALIAAAVAVAAWAIATPSALVFALALTAAYRILRPTRNVSIR
jgi:hypothetical protein